MKGDVFSINRLSTKGGRGKTHPKAAENTGVLAIAGQVSRFRACFDLIILHGGSRGTFFYYDTTSNLLRHPPALI
jgi:hypothetical protein